MEMIPLLADSKPSFLQRDTSGIVCPLLTSEVQKPGEEREVKYFT